MRDWLLAHRLYFALFVAGLLVFGLTSWNRLGKRSTDPHFVYQADAWLHGRLNIEPMRRLRSHNRNPDDPVRIHTVELPGGERVRGVRFLSTDPQHFRPLHGPKLKWKDVKLIETTHYVSFPPFPAVLMIPQVLIDGTDANDVAMTVVIAALVLPLFFGLLRRLVSAGLSDRSQTDDLWLVAALAFGTVFYFSAVQGRVWYTAHVVGVALCVCYVLCAIEARHPILAGLALGLAAVTRTPMAFMFPLFVFEAWRMTKRAAPADGDSAPVPLGDRLRPLAITCAKFAAPVVVIAVAAMLYNNARFDSPLEFGHSYLDVKQQRQIDAFGMFGSEYLSRNLAAAFALLPEISSKSPHIIVNGHGLAIWFTTPLLLLVLWPQRRGPLHRALWTTIAVVAIPTLFYQNTGWLQFGYRFSLDYMVFLLVLIAVGGRPLKRGAKGLIIAGVVINLFGAITFDRYPEYQRGHHTTLGTRPG